MKEHVYPNAAVAVTASWAIRNARYKLIRNESSPCGGPNEF